MSVICVREMRLEREARQLKPAPRLTVDHHRPEHQSALVRLHIQYSFESPKSLLLYMVEACVDGLGTSRFG